MLWHLKKNEIEDWLELKMLAFTQEESAGSQWSVENWVDQYIYTDIHKIFFAKFPIVLHEWLSILTRRQKNFHRREVVEWNDQLVCEVTSVSKTISRAVNFWVENILQGYFTEFALEAITSYSEAEIKIFQGLRRRYLTYLNTWIKMRVCKKWILRIGSVE